MNVWLQRALAALFAGVGAWCLWFQLWLPGQLPTEENFRALAQAVDAEAQAGDVVLLFPWWAEHARMFIPERVRVVGYQGSDGDDLETHPRIWVLGQPRLPGSGMAAFHAAFDARRTPVGETRFFGPLTLALYTNGRASKVAFSAVDSLASARVFLRGADGDERPCIWDGRQHRCQNGSVVAVEWHDIKFQPRQCIRFYPPGGSTQLVAEFAGLPATSSWLLSAGMIWDRGWFHHPGLTVTHIELKAGGQRLGGIALPPGLEGRQRTTISGTPQGTTVAMTSQSDNPELRESCVELIGFEKAP